MMRKFEYKQLSQRDFKGHGGFESMDKLGADGWQLMHVRAGREPQLSDEYLFMREVTTKEEPRSIFEQVFGKGIRW